jgi:signal peptidase II
LTLAVKWGSIYFLEDLLKKYFWDYIFLFSLAGIVIILDQWSKTIVRSSLVMSETWVPWEWLAPYARIVHWHNTGAAFGMLQGLSTVFTILPFFVIGAILYYFPQMPRTDWYLRIAMCMMLGGATGNLIDRLTIGHVTDFISVGKFPVFNVADASISTGTAVLLIGMWIQERLEKASKTQPAESPPDSDPQPITEEVQGD